MTKLSGMIVPLVTPLRPDQSLDEAGLGRLIEHVLEGGARGLFLLGSTGEFALLDREARLQLIRAARGAVRGRAPVLVGISEPGTRAAIEFGQRAVELGAEAVVAAAPFYYNHSQDDLVSHFSSIAREVPAPLVLYNIPRNVKVSLAAETVRRLIEIPNIIGLKDSSGDMAQFQSYLELRSGRPDFSVMQGGELVAALSLVRGADGLVLGPSNVAPRLCHDLITAARAGETERAWRLQARLGELITIHKYKSGPAGIKAACHLMGLCGPTVAPPFEGLSEAQTAQVRQTLIGLGLLTADLRAVGLTVSAEVANNPANP
jgi:2-dehydro-3-deoxy-D-pentonate aldolase